MDSNAIIKACKEGDLTLLQEWIDSPDFAWTQDFSWQDKDGIDLETPAIFIAIDSNQLEATKLLLSANGADINRKDSNDFSPLTWAAMNGNEALINLLLENGAVVDQDALDQAKENGHGDLYQSLRGKIDWYADLDPEDYEEIMLKASREGDVEKVKELIGKGYDMSRWKKEDGETYQETSPIFVAMKNGHIEVIREFLEAGVEAELIETHFNHDETENAPPPVVQEELSEEQMEVLRGHLEGMSDSPPPPSELS